VGRVMAKIIRMVSGIGDWNNISQVLYVDPAPEKKTKHFVVYKNPVFPNVVIDGEYKETVFHKLYIKKTLLG